MPTFKIRDISRYIYSSTRTSETIAKIKPTSAFPNKFGLNGKKVLKKLQLAFMCPILLMRAELVKSGVGGQTNKDLYRTMPLN